MEKGAALLLMLLIVTEALLSQSVANPVECQDSEYLDDHGKCSPCKECAPGFELSKECGYGEGRSAQCTPCQPRKFKDRWGHHGCKSCLSCSLINRAQKFNCSTTSDATCGECFPGFYSKTQIGGSQDLECVPCTKQTPSSEQQCLPRIHLEESSTDPGQDLVLVVLTSSALVLLALVLLTISILYCQQFWKSQCQHVFLRRQNVSGQRSTFPTSTPTGFLCHELLSDPCSLDIKNFSSSGRPIEGLVKAVQFTPGMDVSGFHLPRTEPDTDLSKLMIVTSKTPPARSLLETQPLIRNSGFSNGSSRDSSVTEFRQDCSRDADGPAKLSSCARELQHRWSHSPVECTELDLQTFSTWAGKGTADRDHRQAGAAI
ncbi:tumor necrosis factor receptor superfamily member 27 [Python bivittatus]|uniref:Tumor necrosis factor receptor superfamily member 27 n=1 Tax=Python bivittatus TaxID=176946 RepID=A0A9F5J4R5_PYTBI|nr:tumor necrosis factor receptor superfamily member 27 [Python bivittatus]